KLDLLENYRSKSYIANTNLSHLDVFSYDENEHSAFINYLNIANGAVVQTYTIEYKKQIETEEKESILASGIFEIRQALKSRNRRILVPFIPSFEEKGVELVVPKRGDAKKLMDLSLRNVKQYKLDLLKQQEKLNPEQRATSLMTKMKEDLHLKELPWHIECFDNSNIQGTNPVASCVVFKKAKPSKKDYRHFKIKTVEGPNDFASMEEILTRRYSRLLKEEAELPQLVVVDGGKGQLHSAVVAMSNITKNEMFNDWSEEEKRDGQGKINQIQLIGIAKRLEEIFYPGDSIPLYLDKRSETLKVIQHLRDEAHRFGITFHRDLRSKSQIHSELDDIKHIGEKTKTKLLKEFKSIAGIKKASKEDLVNCVGESKAGIIYDYFNSKQ
ncbi:MAG: excinuclease ABC subunit C, partial [Bacteroidales bacterium]|nr:excinuclease ABC subunit C [Bacteroidales bacterium]